MKFLHKATRFDRLRWFLERHPVVEVLTLYGIGAAALLVLSGLCYAAQQLVQGK